MRAPKACLACLENGRTSHHVAACRAYTAQVAFNKRMTRLRAVASVPFLETAVPAAPDYSTPAAVTARCRERGTLDAMGRTIQAALDGNGRVYRQYRAALRAVAA